MIKPIPVSLKNLVDKTLLFGLYICFVRKSKVLPMPQDEAFNGELGGTWNI